MDRGKEQVWKQFWVAVRRRIEDLGKTIGTRLRSGGLNNVRPHVSTCLHLSRQFRSIRSFGAHLFFVADPECTYTQLPGGADVHHLVFTRRPVGDFECCSLRLLPLRAHCRRLPSHSRIPLVCSGSFCYRLCYICDSINVTFDNPDQYDTIHSRQFLGCL